MLTHSCTPRARDLATRERRDSRRGAPMTHFGGVGGKKTTINLRWERQMWAVDDQRERAVDEASGEEGEDGKGDGDGDDGVV